MKEKRNIITAAFFILAANLACGITLNLPEDAINIGKLVTEEIQLPPPESGKIAKVKLNFGTGKLLIKAGAGKSLINGTAAYNIEELKPAVVISGEEVSISSGSFDYDLTGLPNFSDIENVWDLQFGKYPMELGIRAGAFNAEMDFGGMALHDLDIFGGASSISMDFSSPNLVPMASLNFTTGASNVKLNRLANANFSLFKFKGGGGTYTLDFSGVLLRDATVKIDAGLSTLKLIIPEGVPTEVQVNGVLNSVSALGEWEGGENSFSLAGDGPTITISIDTNAGTLTLDNE